MSAVFAAWGTSGARRWLVDANGAPFGERRSDEA